MSDGRSGRGWLTIRNSMGGSSFDEADPTRRRMPKRILPPLRGEGGGAQVPRSGGAVQNPGFPHPALPRRRGGIIRVGRGDELGGRGGSTTRGAGAGRG